VIIRCRTTHDAERDPLDCGIERICNTAGQGCSVPHLPKRGIGETSAHLGLLDLYALQIFDDCLDVVRVEHEDGHVGVARDNALGQRLG
jgi:hypothetical protein